METVSDYSGFNNNSVFLNKISNYSKYIWKSNHKRKNQIFRNSSFIGSLLGKYFVHLRNYTLNWENSLMFR